MNETFTKSQVDESVTGILELGKPPTPVHVNRISQLDDPCVRRLYYYRHDWDKVLPLPLDQAGRYETGNELERPIMNIVGGVLNEMTPRWRIIGTQLPTKDSLLDEFQISGTIDGLLQVERDGQWFTVGVVDNKSSSPNIIHSLNTFVDLDRYQWTRKYRGQLMLYSLAHNLEDCCILFVNKANLYDIHPIWFKVDMSYCDELLSKARQVNQALDGSRPIPDKLNDFDECSTCPFAAICMPEVTSGTETQVLVNTELEETLIRLAELKETKKEIDELEKYRDEMLPKGVDAVIGRFLIKWKQIIVHYKAKEACDSEQWRKQITDTGITK